MRCSGALWRGVAAAVLIATGGLAPAMVAAEPVVAIADGRGGTTTAEAAAMIARAEARGMLPVIVGFEVAFAPEGTIAAEAAAAQRAAIATAQAGLLARLAAPEEVKRFESIPFMAMVVDAADLRLILAAPGVASVVEDVPVPPALNESVPLINAPKVWRAGAMGRGQVVAVLDTGVQLNHRAFTGKIVSEACYSTRVAGTSTSLCPGGVASSTDPGSGADCPTTIAGCGHGTHVAGIAVGNRRFRRGVAPTADLISIKVFSRFFNDADCGGAGTAPCASAYVSDQVRALERVLALADTHTVVSANMSLGGGAFNAPCDTDARKAVIDNLIGKRVATVIASGNNGWDNWVNSPGCISSAVTVGSTTKTDEISSFSNHARMVDLLAPGSDIEAPVFTRRTNAVGVKSGTSMATPHVAGAWALLRQGKPAARVDEVLRALACTGVLVARNNLPLPRIDVFEARKFLENPVMRRLWNFRTDKQAAQWLQHLGVWRRVGSLFRVVSSGASVWYVASSPFCAADVEVNARVRRTDPDRMWNSGLFLFSRVDDAKNMSGMWFAFSRFDEFGEDKGYGVIWALDSWNGISSTGAARLLCENREADVVRYQGWNNLRVVSQGGTHRFFINGSEVCSATDATFSLGEVAVVMASRSSGHNYDVSRVQAVSLAPLAAEGLPAWQDAPAYSRAAAGAELPAGAATPLGPGR
jgi:subtilisin family serine protease